MLADLEKRRFIQVGLFRMGAALPARGDVAGVRDALDGWQGVAAVALHGVRGCDCGLRALLVAGKEGRAGAAAVYAGAHRASACPGGMEYPEQGDGKREKQGGSGPGVAWVFPSAASAAYPERNFVPAQRFKPMERPAMRRTIVVALVLLSTSSISLLAQDDAAVPDARQKTAAKTFAAKGKAALPKPDMGRKDRGTGSAERA